MTNDVTTDVLIVGRDSDVFAEHLGPQFSGLRFRCAHNSAEALALARPCDILIIRTDEIFADLIAAMPRLRLIQALTTGTDHIVALPNLPPHVHDRGRARLPRAADVGARLPVHARIRAQVSGRAGEPEATAIWDRREQRLLAGKTVVMVGVGAHRRGAGASAARCSA